MDKLGLKILDFGLRALSGCIAVPVVHHRYGCAALHFYGKAANPNPKTSNPDFSPFKPSSSTQIDVHIQLGTS